MLDYIKERAILDFNFLIDYWWFFGIVVLILLGTILIDKLKK